MGKSHAPAPPPAPDLTAAANATAAANKTAAIDTASLNNPNTVTPYGNQSVTYAPTGPNGAMQPTVTQTLTPDAQATLEAQQGVQHSLADLGQQGITTAQNVMSTPFQYNGPGIQTSLGPQQNAQTGLDLSGVAKMPVNAGTTGQAAIMARLQPQIEQQTKATAQTLANQGVTSGSEAYNNAMREQQQGQNDLYSQAALQGLNLDIGANQQGYNQALSSAGLYNQGAAQNYNQNLGAAQFGNTAATQALQQQLGLYNQPLNQINSLMSGSQIQLPQFQSYSGGGQIQGPDLLGAATAQGKNAMDLYGIQANQAASNNSGFMGLLGSAAGAAGMAF